jgi:hypothetical protein
MSLLFASASSADFGVTSFDGSVTDEAGSPYTQGGGHPYQVSTRIDFNTRPDPINGSIVIPDEEVKNIKVDLPLGFVGDPRALPTCSEARLENTSSGRGGTCPANSQIGWVGADTASFFNKLLLGVYNMEPTPGSAATFGFQVPFGGATVHLQAHVRPGDNGVTVEIPNIPQTTPIKSTILTLWGVPAEAAHDPLRAEGLGCGFVPVFPGEPGFNITETFCQIVESPGVAAGIAVKPFLTNPTDCSTGPVTTTLSTDSWEHPGVFHTASFVTHDNASPANPVGPTGCDRLPFDASLRATPDAPGTSQPSGYGFDLAVPQNDNPTGLAEAHLRKAVVTLPEGVAISPSAAAGLQGCSDGQIALHTDTAASCPDASRIGTVTIDTPLLDKPLQGAVYVGTQASSDPASGQMYRLFIVAQQPERGLTIKLAGSVVPDPGTGRLTATFDNNPQLPFNSLHLQLKGGPRAPLSNPSACGTYETKAQLTSWSGKLVESDSSFAIIHGEDGGPCPASVFAPTFTAGTTDPQAGGFSPFTLTLSRSDQDQTLGRVAVKMAPGLLGVLKSVKQCPEPQAAAGACGPESQVGHTTVGAGPGANPFYLGGSVYLTGPYKGAPFGLSVVVPAIAGPFNLGTVVVRAAISVDPHTAQVTVASDPLPTILKGVPLQLRTVNVTIDRSGFIFNPTSCSSQSVGGVITSAQGASVAPSSHFQAANCATLPFKPRLTALTQARYSKAGGESLHVKVTSGPGQANIGKVRVLLPKTLPSRLTTLQKACVDAVFNANPASCPAGSLVGSATAVTPVLAHPLTGPAYLVSHGGAAFPDLVVVLQGEGITLYLDGNTDIKKGITSSTFNSVPDAPISTFDLTLPQGPHSALAANGNLCKGALNMPTTITGQNGAQIAQTTRIAVSGCPKAKKHGKVKHGRKHKKK